MSRRTIARRTLAAAATLAMLAGCGSTVTSTSAGVDAATGDGLGLELATPDPTTGGSTATTSTSGASQNEVSSGPTAAETSPTGSGSDGSSGSATTSPSAVGGVLKPVEVGVILPSTDAGKAFGNAFGQTLDTGDLESMTRAVTGWVNSNGGLAGHQIKPVYYRRCVGCDLATQDQKICTAFAIDRHVTAVIDNTEISSQLARCLGARGVASLGGGVGVFEDKELQTINSFWSSYLMSVDVTFRTLIDRLEARGWFPNGEKLGLIISDAYPVFSQVAPLVKARLKTYGKSFTAEAHIANLGTGDASAAVLKFKAAGVSRVVIIGSGSGAMLVFGPSANAQGYYPKVSVTSLDVLGTAAGLQSAQTYSGATGIGWKPADDGAANRPAPNASEKLCRSIYAAASVSTSGSLAYTEAMALCDSFMFARSAYAKARGITLGDLRIGVPALSGSYLPASTFSAGFGSGVYAGANKVRDVQYDKGCRCFQYISGLASVER